MEFCPYLALAIPTYNRADLLDCCLTINVPLAKQYGVQIFISDNGSTDHTHEVIQRWLNEYPLIRYFRNEVCVDVDDNFEKVLKYPETDYVWLLGDTYQIPEGAIEYFLNELIEKDKNYDAVVFNLDEYTQHIKDREYSDANEVFENFCTLMTCISCLVFSKKLIQNGDFKRYKNTNFIHTGVIFEYLAKNKFHLFWIQSYSISGFKCHKAKKHVWAQTNHVFDIACHRWSAFVFSLPASYPLSTKYKVISDFGTISGILTIRNLIHLRRINLLNLLTYLKYKDDFKLTIKLPQYLIILVAIAPKFLLPIIRLFVSISSRITKLFSKFNKA